MKKAEAKKAEALKVLKDYIQELEPRAKRNVCSEDYKLYMAVNIAIEKLEQPEIVHCKDCKKWCNGDDIYGICNWNEYLTLQTAKDGYCSCGKRRDE